MTEYYTITLLTIKTILAAYTVSRFEPLKMILELLPDKLLPNLLTLLLTCSKCLAFWIGLIIAGPWIAMGASFIITILEKTLFSWIEQTRLN